MKMKRFCFLMLVLLLIGSLAVPAFAAGEESAKLNHVTDQAGMLSGQEQAELEKMAQAFSQEYECSLYILVVDDFRDYASDTFRFCIDVRDQYDLGWGSERACSMLMLSMADRDYELYFHGSMTDRVFTEYGRDRMEERFLEYFRKNDFYGGFREYLSCSGEYLLADRNGHPVDREKEFSLLFFVPGVFAALIACIVVTAPMKSAMQKTEANAYAVNGGVTLHQQSDIFVNRTVTRRAKESSSGGSGGSHRSGSSSGRSGKF